METCPCCGYKTIEECGNYEICPICYWEDDSVQSADPWFQRGANNPSLFEAQINYKKFGAIEKRLNKNTRSPKDSDLKDSNWRELSETDKRYCTTPTEIENVYGTSEVLSYKYWERNV